MHTCTGATAGLRFKEEDGLGPTSSSISLTLGILLGGPDAADSATRLVSLLPDAAFDKENLHIAIRGLERSRGCSGVSAENSCRHR